MPLTYRTCKVCSKGFTPSRNPLQTCCCRDCSKINNNNRCHNWYERRKDDPIFKQEKRKSAQRYAQKPQYRNGRLERRKQYRIAHRQEQTDYVRNKTAKIRLDWSNGTSGRKTWREAEDVALQILPSEGFQKAISLKDFKHNFYFDAKGETRNGTKCVFQITTRIHTELKRRLKYARILGLHFYVLYIRPSLDGYIIKDAEKPGAHSIYYTDLKNIRTMSTTKLAA